MTRSNSTGSIRPVVARAQSLANLDRCCTLAVAVAQRASVSPAHATDLQLQVWLCGQHALIHSKVEKHSRRTVVFDSQLERTVVERVLRVAVLSNVGPRGVLGPRMEVRHLCSSTSREFVNAQEVHTAPNRVEADTPF